MLVIDDNGFARGGVLGGATDEATLAEWSDVLISSIDEITAL